MERVMKDSGVEWIGVMPLEWTISKMKYVGHYINGYAFKPDDWSSKGKPIIRIQDLTGSHVNPNYYGGDLEEKYLVKEGDMLVSWAATLDAFIWKGEEGWLNQHIFKADPNEDVIKREYFYWLIKVAMENMNNDNKHGIMMQHVTLDVFENFSVPVPPLYVQQRIAETLNAHISKLESTIKKIEESVADYKYLKQAVITQAVTKGVRGDRPMKDSGIEWLKEIPSTWSAEKGKRLFVETNQRSVDGSEELLTVSHITGVTPRKQKNVNMFMAETLVDYKICHVGDMAANTMWMWQGAIGVSKYYGVISPSYNTYRQSSGAYDSEYLDYMLRAKPLIGVYNAYSTGITISRLRLYPEQFFSINFPVPPMDEQLEIAAYLDAKCAEIDALIAQKEQLLTELENYKKSLIYEYVTGKKEVPHEC